MRTIIQLMLIAAFLGLKTKALISEEPTRLTKPLPTGKLAFVTSESFGRAGKICFIEGDYLYTAPTFMTRELDFSPFGRLIYYCANESRARGLCIYDLDEEGNIPMEAKLKDAESPSISPDEFRIAFVRYQEERKSSQIYTANIDGSDEKQLTEGQYYNWSPHWSPGGEYLVFETTRNDNPDNHVKNGGHRDIYLMDADGQNQINLTSGAYGHSPSWSPDGKLIAYMARGGIWVMESDGSAKRNISHATTRDSEPAWSPDGQWIAFTRTDKTSGPSTMDIWIMKSDGTEQRQITYNKANSASYSPSWSK